MSLRRTMDCGVGPTADLDDIDLFRRPPAPPQPLPQHRAKNAQERKGADRRWEHPPPQVTSPDASEAFCTLHGAMVEAGEGLGDGGVRVGRGGRRKENGVITISVHPPMRSIQWGKPCTLIRLGFGIWGLFLLGFGI
ncbi:hypothetical protein CRG98_029773 [Punica granatum]|uniref:Uncharacterized protein n=1 Tax=Punica granatum TaxID=22663 RepID=A0A2I0J0R3_PUNGR|nr:hypothetical protein CRG98_029773 [Punica granatum]